MKIQLKRSGDAGVPPGFEQMAYGELAVNYNASDPTIFTKDSDDNVVVIARSNQLYEGYPNLDDGNGVSLDDRYVKVNGDIMVGQLTLPGGGGNVQAIQRQEVLALINGSDTGAGLYVALNGDDVTRQIVTGTAGVEAGNFYSRDSFFFQEVGEDTGMKWVEDNKFDIVSAGTSIVNIEPDAVKVNTKLSATTFDIDSLPLLSTAP